MPAPDELPESIVLQRFAGVRNIVGAERLALEDLETALNVDIDDAGQVRRRRGYALGASGSYHSVRTLGSQVIGVKDGALGWIGTDYTFTSLTTVGTPPLSYAQVGYTTYFSSAAASGKIVDDTVSAWGALASEGTWLSPVVTPTDTLGAIGGRLLGAPPLATEIEYYKGRIYLAAEKYLWATELYLYDYVDKTRGVIQFEEDITLVRAVEDGVYVGTTKALYFLRGTFAEGLKRETIVESPVIRGSSVVVPTSKVHPGARQGPMPEGEGAVFLTGDGVMAAFDRGEVYSLTQNRVVFPQATSAAALYRDQDGVNQFVAVADSGGSPTSNARIGDYVSAEIVRFQGG